MRRVHLYERCRGLFLNGVIDGLKRSKSCFESMQRTSDVNAMALDVYPWHSSVSLAARVETVSYEDRYSIADWPNFDFANEHTSPALKKAADFAADCYGNKPESMEYTEAAHFIFLAAAEALLDPSVADTLQALGVDAPVPGDGIGGVGFEYLVRDVDETCRANYCDIICANRTTARLIDVWNRQR